MLWETEDGLQFEDNASPGANKLGKWVRRGKDASVPVDMTPSGEPLSTTGTGEIVGSTRGDEYETPVSPDPVRSSKPLPPPGYDPQQLVTVGRETARQERHGEKGDTLDLETLDERHDLGASVIAGRPILRADGAVAEPPKSADDIKTKADLRAYVKRHGITPGTSHVTPGPPSGWQRMVQHTKQMGVAKRITGHAGKRMGGAWRNLPEDLRPEQLAGGMVVYPFNRSDYEARLQQAVQDGKVSPKVAKQVMAGYDKWKRTPWGAMVDYSRLKREEKHIGMEAKADSDLIAEEKARSDAELYQKLEKASAQAQEDYEIERLAYQEELDDAVAKQQSAIDMLASRKVDPNRWWNSRSDAQKVVGALSIALGTAASAAAGVYGRPTANVAYDIIKNTISRDLRAQEVDLSSAKAAVRGRQGLLGTMRAQVGDTAQARELARMALMDQTKAKLQMYASNAQGDAARRNAQMLMDLIDNDREIIAAELRMKAANMAARRASGRVAAKKKKEVPAGLPWMTEADIRRVNPALGGIVRGDEAIAKGIASKVAANNAMFGGLSLVKKYMSSPGYVFGTEDRRAAGDLYQAIQQIKRKDVMGTASTMTEKDMDHSGQLTEDATKRLMGSISKTLRGGRLPLDALAEQTRREVLSEMSHLTVYPGHAVYGAGVAKTGIRKGQPEGVGGWRFKATGPSMSLPSAFEITDDGKLVPIGVRSFAVPQPVRSGAAMAQPGKVKVSE
jgi:hypothetical protein